MDRAITGNFDVSIVNSNTLIHSKKRGQKNAASSEERKLIVEKIKAALETI